MLEQRDITFHDITGEIPAVDVLFHCIPEDGEYIGHGDAVSDEFFRDFSCRILGRK